MQIRTGYKIVFFIIVSLVIISLLIVYINQHWAKRHFIYALKNVNQNIVSFLNPTEADKPLLSQPNQKIFYNNFIAHYFSPWTDLKLLKTSAMIKATKQKVITLNTLYLKNPGWNSNYYPHSKKWLKKIVENEDLATFPNDINAAITLYPTQSRAFPTLQPSFRHITQAGWGYPFDDFQVSFIHAGTPIATIQLSKDKAWTLIETPSFIAWVPSKNIAYADKAFQKRWRTKKFVALIRDNVSPQGVKNNHALFAEKIGSLFPLIAIEKNQFSIHIAISNKKQQANIANARIPKPTAIIMPWQTTERNVARLINGFQGETYGWGDIYNERDCSATLKDLFTPFGLWLPRHSKHQAHAGHFISFNKLNETRKIKALLSRGVPFFTIIPLKGHVMLYIGNKKGVPYVFQNVWGLPTKNLFGKSGRALFGRAVITPITLGKKYFNIPKSFLDSSLGMTILADVSYLPLGKSPDQLSVSNSR